MRLYFLIVFLALILINGCVGTQAGIELIEAEFNHKTNEGSRRVEYFISFKEEVVIRHLVCHTNSGLARGSRNISISASGSNGIWNFVTRVQIPTDGKMKFNRIVRAKKLRIRHMSTQKCIDHIDTYGFKKKQAGDVVARPLIEGESLEELLSK